MATPLTVTGSRTVFVWNDLAVGFCASLNGEESIEYAPIDVLNLLTTREHVPVAYRCSFNSSLFRRVAAHARNVPAAGRNQSIMPNIDDIMLTEGLKAVAQVGNGQHGSGTASENNMYAFTDAKCQSRSFDMPARGAVVESLSFVAIRLENEQLTVPVGSAV